MFLVEKNETMIVVRLSGGLGNQLFQYAAGRRLAHILCAELVLDLNWYAHIPSSDTPRIYELSHYPIHARTTTSGESLWCRLHDGRLLRRLSLLPRRWRHCREKSFAFEPLFLDLSDNTYLDGYWQSYHYFEDVSDLIRAELMPIVSFSVQDNKVATLIAAENAVSVHVRRGDYVTNQTALGHHGLCSLDYYNEALERMLLYVARPHFFIFSDDPAWTRENLRLPGPATFVNHNGPDTAFQDLRLMSLCNHQITANSSFSWWGAWLNQYPEKMVIAPKRWFNQTSHDTSDLLPDSWIKL